MAQVAICDDTTGEIVAYIIVPDGDLSANVGTGQVSVAITSPVSTEGQYIDDPTGTPALTTRPTNTAVIPEVVQEGADLYITGTPDGATVTVLAITAGSTVHSGTKGGGTGTYDAATTGASEGDILSVEVSLWPYTTVRGLVEVTAP
jgi:hypothetical protein